VPAEGDESPKHEFRVRVDVAKSSRDAIGEMVLVMKDGKPIYVRQLAKDNGKDAGDGMHLPPRKIEVICSWPGRSPAQIEAKILDLVKEKDLEKLGLSPMTIMPESSPGKVIVTVTPDADVEVLKVLSKVREELAKMWIDIPKTAREPVARLAEEKRMRRIVVRAKAGADKAKLRKAIAQAVEKFRTDEKAFPKGLVVEETAREAAPEVKLPIIIITTIHEGASPADVESTVANEIAQKLQGMTGVKNITSSCLEGLSTITVEFKPNVSIEVALQRVRDKVDQAELPPEVEEPVLTVAGDTK